MSYKDYKDGQRLELITLEADIGFYGIIQCAMRRADTDNTEKLRSAFPRTYLDLTRRYNAPGGLLDGEIDEQ